MGRSSVKRRTGDWANSRPARKPTAARKAIEAAPPIQGWHSTDSEEIERRRWRGRTENLSVKLIEPRYPYFGTFRVHSASGRSYEVEIRSLDRLLNSCECADYRVNGLGTCKHIEGVLASLKKRGSRAYAAAARSGSARTEIFVPGNADIPQILWPKTKAAVLAGRPLLAKFLDAEGQFGGSSAEFIETALHSVTSDGEARTHIRISRSFRRWIDVAKRRAARGKARERFLAEVSAGKQTLDVLRHPLLPYQREGVLHLAFGERALLADDMGLGKTVQAIGACELLRRLHGIASVLVVCPASLKGEWQEQIARFSGATTRLVSGGRSKRLLDYERPAFFTVVNYEQVVIDAPEINDILKPDVIVLDEAQRIKNWHTKTASAVKSLTSTYAFVLTGTPIENRIDEIYSIVQFLDPGLLGPLFRFNREFYRLDEHGRPVDYKNLDDLLQRVKPIMLRRRKRDVETELPGRTLKNYSVGMAAEQRLRYDEYKSQAARLIHLAQRRPLQPKEFERLQQILACMRMLCDSPFILDPDCRLCPKLEELERLIPELLGDGERKIILFSEWERMLLLVRELAEEMGIEFAWHTGSVPQDRRRAEIARFKRDPGCRLFLSTDCGAVGLNLQAASAVVNLDLPWNPARLEQRIARAWRKNQARAVDVINLVTEDSIEHNMLQVLAQKQALADGVLDGTGDLRALKMPSGRRALVERMAAIMQPSSAPPPAVAATATARSLEEELRDGLRERYGEALLLIEERQTSGGGMAFVVVLDGDAAAAAREQQRLAMNGGAGTRSIRVLDRATYEAMARLTDAGLVQISSSERRELFRSPRLGNETDSRRQHLRRCVEWLGGAERKLKMALLLAEGGFAEEAMPVLGECLALAGNAQAALNGEHSSDAHTSQSPAPPRLVSDAATLSPSSALAGAVSSAASMLAALRQDVTSLQAAE
jgi:hypothetical protein